MDHPGGDGDFESLAAIRFYYGPARVCPQPLALEARTTDWALPSTVGERVHLNPARGFWCLNREQPRGRRCSNYHVRFRCPLGEGGARGRAYSRVGGLRGAGTCPTGVGPEWVVLSRTPGRVRVDMARKKMGPLGAGPKPRAAVNRGEALERRGWE